MKHIKFTLSFLLAIVISTTAVTAQQNKTIGIQLYSVMPAMNSDAEGSLKRLAGIGYNACELVQWGGDSNVFGMKPSEFKNACSRNGIEIISTHSGIQEDSDTPESVEKRWLSLFQIQKSLGGKYFIVPSYNYENTTEGVKAMAAYFNRIGKIANEYGLKFGYHNHSHEFKPLNDNPSQTMYDLFTQLTDSGSVCLELDVYWAQKADRNPVELLKTYPGRIKILHIKDDFTIGQSGKMDFESIFRQFYANGHTDYVVEIETPASLRQKTGHDGKPLTETEIMDEVFKSADLSWKYLNNATFTL